MLFLFIYLFTSFRLQHENDNVINYTYEYEKLEKETALEQSEVDHLEHVLKIIERFGFYVCYFLFCISVQPCFMHQIYIYFLLLCRLPLNLEIKHRYCSDLL